MAMVGLRDQLSKSAQRRCAVMARNRATGSWSVSRKYCLHPRAPAVARARDHDDLSFLVGLQLVGDPLHLEKQRRIHRVALFRTIERDPGNSFAVGLDQHTSVFLLLSHMVLLLTAKLVDFLSSRQDPQ